MQYTTKVQLSDAEVIALQDAIKTYKDFIEREIKEEIKAPYWSRLQAIKTVEQKIKNNNIDELL